MANVPRPGRKTGLVMTADEILPSSNLGKPPAGKTQDLNFKVDGDFHYKFKMEATQRRMTMIELLRVAFDEYIERHPFE